MRNQDNVDKTYKAIWATFYHLCSTDKKPNHDNCPEGAESWCAYRRAEAEGMMSKFKHDYLPLHPKVEEALKLIYEDLSRYELLVKCKGSNTQNNNESYNGLTVYFGTFHQSTFTMALKLSNYQIILQLQYLMTVIRQF